MAEKCQGASNLSDQQSTDVVNDRSSIPSEDIHESQSLLEDDGKSEKSVKNAITGSFASFRDDVYAPTTVTTASADAPTYKERCGACLKGLCTSCYIKLKPVMWKYHPKPTSQSPILTRFKYSLLCPPHGNVALVLMLTLSIILGFGLIWSITGNEGLPGGNFFGLFVMFILCTVSGWAISYIKLPPLLGMLIMGCILGNVPHIDMGRDITPGWSSGLRKIALAVILCRAGLGLDPKALKRMSFVVIRLAFMPCLVEAVVCMISSHYIIGLPWIWGLMLGFVLAAVSPAVVVPCLLSLSERGYGLDKGIPTLVIAAASIDDVLAISAFSICLGIAFSESDNLALTIFKGPLEAIAGILYGIILGIIVWYLPTKKSNHLELKRTGLLLSGGLFALFGSDAANIAGAGALGCLTLPFVAALRWRKELPKDTTEMPMERYFGYLWQVFQPLLFGLIGAAVDLQKIDDYTTLGLGVAVLVIGLIFRLIASFLAVSWAGFTLREKLFIPLAWLPKATVQALIGSYAYDKALMMENNDDQKKWGLQILTIAVLVILITAPLGAAAISLAGPRLLVKSTGEQNSQNSRTDIPVDSAAAAKLETASVELNVENGAKTISF